MIMKNTNKETRCINEETSLFDIDGTLVTRNDSIPQSTIEAIQQLKRNGNIPVIAAGRAPVLMKSF